MSKKISALISIILFLCVLAISCTEAFAGENTVKFEGIKDKSERRMFISSEKTAISVCSVAPRIATATYSKDSKMTYTERKLYQKRAKAKLKKKTKSNGVDTFTLYVKEGDKWVKLQTRNVKISSTLKLDYAFMGAKYLARAFRVYDSSGVVNFTGLKRNKTYKVKFSSTFKTIGKTIRKVKL